MEHLDLVGVRFSSAKPPNPTWIAWGTERAGTLSVEGVEHVGATLADRLARGLPRVLAVDTPLGVPLGLARALVPLVTNGSQVLENLVLAAPSQLDAAWAAFATEHPGALRLTDAITHGAPTVTAPRPPVWRALRAVARLLWPLRDRLALVPFDTLELTPARTMALEVQPGATLRLLTLPYGAYRGAPEGTPPHGDQGAAERLHILAALPQAVTALGVRAEVSASAADACAADAGGDALDAVLACVTAHLATRGLWTPPPLSGPYAARAMVEGWIVRPG